MTSKEDIKGWLERGKELNASHVIVVCDTFDWEDYPVFVMPTENLLEKVAGYDGESMQKVMEVYNLSLPFEAQLDERRAFNF